MTQTTNHSIKEVFETPGFLRAFHRMARYTLRTCNEARIEIMKSFKPSYINKEGDVNGLIYGIGFGGEGRVSLKIDRLTNYAATTNLKKEEDIEEVYNKYETIFDIHTHPVGEGAKPLEFIRLSEDDIKHHLFMHWRIPTGVVVFPSRKSARCLLWQPRAKYSEETAEGIAYDLEMCMKEQKPDKEAVEYLRLNGCADTIDFVLKDRLWQPKQKHLSRLENFLIKNIE